MISSEEPNDQDDGDSEVEPINPLVDALFDEIEELRHKVGPARAQGMVVFTELLRIVVRV